MIALQALTPDELVQIIPGISLTDARRIASGIHRGGGLEFVRRVKQSVIDAAAAAGSLPKLTVCANQRSGVDPFIKYILEVPGGGTVEAVRIPLDRPGRFSVCVSSQAGCGLGCSFCATGRLGLHRNLEAWEIIEQLRIVRGGLDPRRGERIHGIVFQGMGEPLANLDAVLQAIAVACNPSTMAVNAKAITVCTVGLPEGIRQLAAEAPKVRLGISIGSALPEVRRRLMPIDRAHPLEQVMAAVADHSRKTRIAPMWAVTLLEGVNDSPEHAAALARLGRDFVRATGVRPRISIVPYNADAGGRDEFRRTARETESAFREVLHRAGLATHRRYSGGHDIAAACGQLAAAGR